MYVFIDFIGFYIFLLYSFCMGIFSTRFRLIGCTYTINSKISKSERTLYIWKRTFNATNIHTFSYISPHFIFYSIRNIYILTKEKLYRDREELKTKRVGSKKMIETYSFYFWFQFV